MLINTLEELSKKTYFVICDSVDHIKILFRKMLSELIE